MIDDSKVYLNESWGGIIGDSRILFPLTPCCQANGYGRSDDAVRCWGCDRPYPAVFRQAVRVTDPLATRKLAAILAGMQGVPAVQRHTDLASALVGREAARWRHPSRSARVA